MLSDDIKICEGISDISDSYQGFLIDQWGTLHDGERVFPDAIEALESLRQRGKQVILISNSGKRACDDRVRLNAMGLDKSLYDHIVTSTETTWQNLNDRDGHKNFQDLGKSFYLINRDGDIGITDGLEGANRVDDIEDADFILLTGTDAPKKTLEDDYEPILKVAARKQIKMICANPQKTITVSSQKYMGSGTVARRYEEMGGVVTYIGKPFPSIFQYALNLFDDLYPSQICMIGDSLAHDIRGARYLDVDCAFIASGIHAGSFTKVKSKADIQKMMKILGKNNGALPNYFIPKFHWGRALPDRKNKRKGEK